MPCVGAGGGRREGPASSRGRPSAERHDDVRFGERRVHGTTPRGGTWAGAPEGSVPLDQKSGGWPVREREKSIGLGGRGLGRAFVEDPAGLRGDECDEQRRCHGCARNGDRSGAVIDAAAVLAAPTLVSMTAGRRSVIRTVMSRRRCRCAHRAQSVHLARYLTRVAQHHRAQQSEEERSRAQEASGRGHVMVNANTRFRARECQRAEALLPTGDQPTGTIIPTTAAAIASSDAMNPRTTRT